MKTLVTEYNDLVNRLTQIKPDSKAVWGSMNVNEMIVHVSQPLLIALARKEGIDKSNFFSRTFLKYIALNMMSKIPKGLKAPKDFDGDQSDLLIKNFEENKLKLFALMADFKNDNSAFINRIHPAFGVFNKQEWAIQSYLHLDHHFRQFGN